MIIQPIFLGTFTLFAIILSACAAAGISLSWLLSGKDREHLVDGGLLLSLIVLIGSRASYVIRNFSYYLDFPLEIPQFWLGGLSWPGAVIGTVVGILFVHLIWKEPIGELVDSYLAFYGLLALGAWLAGWGTQAGYGPPTDAWFGIPVKDLFGHVEHRWPLPILGAVVSAGWTAGVIFFPLKRQRNPGFRGALGAAGLVALNGMISFIRVDPSPSVWGIRIESWISLILFGACMVYLHLIQPKDKNEPIDT